MLDLAIGRRVDGLLAGDYRSAYTGIGTEFHQVRPYEPGDDVRRIDWNVTARTGQTHVRVELAEHTLVTWLVLDESASMRFGTATRRKADVAEGVAIAIGHVATRRGNRLGVVAYGAGEPRLLPPRRGRRGLLLALGAIRDTPGGDGRLREAMNLVGGLAVERSLVVVVSDFRGPVDWKAAASARRCPPCDARHRDPRPQGARAADVGELHLVDPETGRHVLVDTDDPVLRELFADAAVEERRAVASLLSSAGAPGPTRRARRSRSSGARRR